MRRSIRAKLVDVSSSICYSVILAERVHFIVYSEAAPLL
jgi:hypothetical protein